MHEKRTIIGELLTQARIYLDEQVEMIINTVQEYNEVPRSCLKCEGPLKKIYERDEKRYHLIVLNAYDLIVLKCKKCDIYFAFYVEPSTYASFFEDPAIEDEHRGGRMMKPPRWKYAGKSQWGYEGKPPKYSKKVAKAYEREVSRLSDLNKRLNNVVYSKLAEMYNIGLSVETINATRNRVLEYLKDNFVTSKQLVSLFTAALYEVSHEELAGVDGYKRVREKVTERQLEKIFGVTRKTIRKWRKNVSTQHIMG